MSEYILEYTVGSPSFTSNTRQIMLKARDEDAARRELERRCKGCIVDFVSINRVALS